MRMRPAQVLRPGDVLQYVVTAAVLKNNATGKNIIAWKYFSTTTKQLLFYVELVM